jgi:scyllo-inositol 2-dehydrogenase (NADP+)
MKKNNVGLLGIGLSGRVFHTSLLKTCEHFKVKKVFSSRVNEIQEVLPNAEMVNNIENIINDSGINCRYFQS